MLPSFRMLPIFSMGLVLLVSPVNAAIICDGGFQVVRGEPVSTPYCQDEALAAFARKNGARTSGDEIRRSSDLKRQSCVAAGDTNTQPCGDYLAD
jgi:hypothetical protein